MISSTIPKLLRLEMKSFMKLSAQDSPRNDIFIRRKMSKPYNVSWLNLMYI